MGNKETCLIIVDGLFIVLDHFNMAKRPFGSTAFCMQLITEVAG
jgi:hypothetical protein